MEIRKYVCNWWNHRCKYVLWPLAKRVQNWIVDRSTARDFTVGKFKIIWAPLCELYNNYYRAKRRDFLRLFESQIDYLLNLLLLLRVYTIEILGLQPLRNLKYRCKKYLWLQKYLRKSSVKDLWFYLLWLSIHVRCVNETILEPSLFQSSNSILKTVL